MSMKRTIEVAFKEQVDALIRERLIAQIQADERERIAKAIESADYEIPSHHAWLVALSVKRQAARVARSGGEVPSA